MPAACATGPADNWRVLISIADASGISKVSGRSWGEVAREAAVAMSRNQDEDLAVTMLIDIREIFNRQPTADRLNSVVLVTS